VGLDEPARLGREAVGQVLARRPVLQARVAVRTEVPLPAVGPAAFAAAPVDVEALVLRPEPLRAQVPLAREEGRVAGVLHRLGQRDLLVGQSVAVGRGQQPRVSPPLARLVAAAGVDVVGHAHPLGVLARHDAGPRGRAHGARRVSVGEPHARRRQAVHVRRVVERAAAAAQVRPAEVVDEEEHEVGPSLRLAGDQGAPSPRPECGGRRHARELQETASIHPSFSFPVCLPRSDGATGTSRSPLRRGAGTPGSFTLAR
jgi:hypothetical protein